MTLKNLRIAPPSAFQSGDWRKDPPPPPGAMHVDLMDYTTRDGWRKGKCGACRVVYVWRGRPLLRDACCKRCDRCLSKTSKLWRGRWVEETPKICGGGS